jgi:drug/metabolite transporter (DMT)-like permease
MFAAFLTTIFFGFSVIFASRSARILGTLHANFGRMILATLLLAAWGHLYGTGVGGPALHYFILSGCIGFGLGDIALFEALPRIGPRLTVLLTQCLAAPFAAVFEWTWLRTALTWNELLWSTVVLAGVAIALAPDRNLAIGTRQLAMGSMFGVFAALGQALGAVISRAGYQVSELGNFPIDGGTAAYQRTIGGLFVTGIFFFVMNGWGRSRGVVRSRGETMLAWRHGWPWVVLNGLAGPAIGVGCYQWALLTEKSALVLPIVATTPVVAMVLSFLFEGDRPSRRAIAGGIIAVAGSIGLAIS